MSGAIQKNFRGCRALIVQSDVSGRDTLVRTLGKLGLLSTVRTPEELTAEDIAQADVVFVDADEGSEPIFGDGQTPDAPIIAIIGSEAPSRLSRVVRARAASHVQKPVRSSGVFTAILLAMNEHAHRQRLEQESAALRRRLAARRKVIKAVLSLMVRWGIDEDEAYQRLRSTAMHERIPVEEAAERVLRQHKTGPEPRKSSRSSD